MPDPSLTRLQVLILLAETPQRLAALTTDLSPEALQTKPTSGGWSANDVLAHLRSCADVWGNCIRTIIAQDHPTLRAVNPRTWIKKTDYDTLDFQTSLAAFDAQRAELLAALKPLAREDWLRSATVKGAGKVLERTILTYGRWLARHEQPHLKQIERLVKQAARASAAPDR
ncbi:MAG TPA: DinB family protein [Ktedonobacterales bacterium]|jgi:uncharacterized damage-inducible protein DinB